MEQRTGVDGGDDGVGVGDALAAAARRREAGEAAGGGVGGRAQCVELAQEGERRAARLGDDAGEGFQTTGQRTGEALRAGVRVDGRGGAHGGGAGCGASACGLARDARVEAHAPGAGVGGVFGVVGARGRRILRETFPLPLAPLATSPACGGGGGQLCGLHEEEFRHQRLQRGEAAADGVERAQRAHGGDAGGAAEAAQRVGEPGAGGLPEIGGGGDRGKEGHAAQFKAARTRSGWRDFIHAFRRGFR